MAVQYTTILKTPYLKAISHNQDIYREQTGEWLKYGQHLLLWFFHDQIHYGMSGLLEGFVILRGVLAFTGILADGVPEPKNPSSIILSW